jgi:hypothetical protein
MSTKPKLQRILKGIIHTEEQKNNQKCERSKKIKLKRQIDEHMRARKVASMINSVNLKTLKINNAKSKDNQYQTECGKICRNTGSKYLLIITLNVHRHNSPIKRHKL